MKKYFRDTFKKFAPNFLKQKLQKKYTFTVIQSRKDMWGEQQTRYFRYVAIDFENVLKMHIEKHGLSPSVIRCEQNIIGTLAENGANYPLVTVQAPPMDFIGIGAEVKDAYLQEINKHGTKSLTVKPKELIWANATAIAQIKKAIKEARDGDNS